MGKRKQVKKNGFRDAAVAFFIFALTQIVEAKKAYLKIDEDFRFSMLLFIVFLSISFLLTGIYFGISYSEKQIGKRNSKI